MWTDLAQSSTNNNFLQETQLTVEADIKTWQRYA